jgi:hypothetical protein
MNNNKLALVDNFTTVNISDMESFLFGDVVPPSFNVLFVEDAGEVNSDEVDPPITFPDPTPSLASDSVIDEVRRRLAIPVTVGRGCRNVTRTSPYERPSKESVSFDANHFFKLIWTEMYPKTIFIASIPEHSRNKEIILQIYKERS